MEDILEKIVSLCKRRGFAFPSAQIYGGTRSSWDFGPYGIEMKNNIRNQWWKAMVTNRDDVVGLDSAVILPRAVFEASGHLQVFNDPLIECKSCHKRYRVDELVDEFEQKHGKKPQSKEEVTCKNCGVKAQWTDPRDFNMMVKTHLGPVENENSVCYLRPETAQGIFLNFQNVQTTMRKKLPFGIAQVGKSFRNEITPGNFLFRTREFEQMEMEYFIEPETADKYFDEWLQTRWNWYRDLGLREENMRYYEHPKAKLAHYSKKTTDIEYRFNFRGIEWGELEGVAYRGDFDLKTHSEHSKKDLRYFNQAKNERYFPHVIEPAAGLARSFIAFLIDAYDEDEAMSANGKVEKRTVLHLHPKIAPVKIAVLPLTKDERLVELAHKIVADFRKEYSVQYDISGAIGRRYRRQDEVGTPYCVTVDFDTLDDNAVTVRDRDSMKQIRVSLDKLDEYFSDKF